MNAREQFGRRLVINLRPGVRRWLKRRYSKAARQEAKRDPECDGRRRYRGFYD